MEGELEGTRQELNDVLRKLAPLLAHKKGPLLQNNDNV